MAAARFFLALLLLTAATAAFAHADEGSAFDITTTANAPRKVLNGGSDGLLASAASQVVSVLQGAMAAIETALNLNAPVPGASNEVKELSGLAAVEEVLKSEHKAVIFFYAPGHHGPSMAIAPTFETASKRFPGLPFYKYKLDTDAERDVAITLGIRMVPEFKAYLDGDDIDSVKGAHPVALYKMIEMLARLQ